MNIMKTIAIIAVLLISTSAYAKPQVVGWTWPISDCDGVVIAASDLRDAVFIYDVNPMPMPSDTDGPCTVTPDPDAPVSATSESITVTQTQVTLNLMPGMTYYARIRVSAFVDGNWSNWSSEYQFTVPYGKPNRIIWLN